MSHATDRQGNVIIPPGLSAPTTDTGAKIGTGGGYASQALERSWTNEREPLVNLVHETELTDISLEETVGAQAIKTEDTLSFPLIFEYSASTRRTSYRRGAGMIDLVDGRAPADSSWVEIDPRMSLRKALDLYGHDLLAFEKVVRRTRLEIIVLPVRQRHAQTLRVLIRRPTKSS